MSRAAGWTEGPWVDIGSGHRYRMVYQEGVAVALDEVHSARDDKGAVKAGNPCAGWIPFTGRSPRSVTWDLVSESPLTLNPSLLCACGEHGYIRNGTWEKC